jgi:glycosyltransferase 2 family protein
MRTLFERLAPRAAALASHRHTRPAVQVLLVAALAFALLRLRSVWSDAHVDWRTLDWKALVGAGALAAAGVVGAAGAWLVILLRLGSKPRPRWAAIFVQTQLAKYLPGSVWNYAGRAALTRLEGVGVRIFALSITVELAAAVVGGAVVAALIAGWSGLAASGAVAAIAAASLRLVRSTWPERAQLAVALREGSAGYVFVWVLTGLSFWMTARALFGTPFRDVGYYAGAFAVSALAGMFAFFAPVGLGVREAVIVALLRSRLGTADAVVLAAASRGVLTTMDVLTAAGGAVWLRQSSGRWRRRRAPS